MTDQSVDKREVRCASCRKLLYEIRVNLTSAKDWVEVIVVCPRCKKRDVDRFCIEPLESRY